MANAKNNAYEVLHLQTLRFLLCGSPKLSKILSLWGGKIGRKLFNSTL